MAELLLIRHGKACFGEADYDRLNALGEKQSQALGAALKTRLSETPVCVCGSQRRHQQTAQHTLNAMGLAPLWHCDPGFDEYDHTAILAAQHPQLHDRDALRAWLAQQAEPRAAFQDLFADALRRWQRDDGDYPESFAAFLQRVNQSLQALAGTLNHHDTALVFTSGGTISAVLQQQLGLDGDALIHWNRALINTSVTRLLVEQGQIRLVSVNDTLHLPHELVITR